MSGEFDKDGIGWFIANDYLYAVTRKHLNGKDIHCQQHVFMQFITDRQQEPGMVIYGRAKYLFDPKTEKFKYLIGFDWSHRNSDISLRFNKRGCKGPIMDVNMVTWILHLE
jgi:hypothetical protein